MSKGHDMLKPAFLVMVNVADESWSFRIDAHRKLVGRSSEATIRIPPQFPYVSRRHAEVWCDKAGMWLQDVGSQGGTRVNGVCLDNGHPAQITIGDRITFSDVETKVVSQVSTLAELLVEAQIPASPPLKDEESTIIPAHIRTADIVRATLEQLTPAELEIVLWMHRGFTTDDELGKVLFRSPNTVRTQLTGIIGKLNVQTRADVMGWLKRASTKAQRAADTERRVGYKTKTW